jgi:hypothetical protein
VKGEDQRRGSRGLGRGEGEGEGKSEGKGGGEGGVGDVERSGEAGKGSGETGRWVWSGLGRGAWE